MNNKKTNSDTSISQQTVGEEFKPPAEEIEIIAKHLSDSASDLPSLHGDNELVPQFVPTKQELMILASHYLDEGFRRKAIENQGGEHSVEDTPSDPYAWRGSGILSLINLLFGEDEQERLESEHFTPLKEKWGKRLGGVSEYSSLPEAPNTPHKSDKDEVIHLILENCNKNTIHVAGDALGDLLEDADELMWQELIGPIFKYSDFWTDQLASATFGLGSDNHDNFNLLKKEIQSRVKSKQKG